MYKAGIIGLGNIGSLFDKDSKRVGIWTHATAYKKTEGVLLASGSDPNEDARNFFRDFHKVQNIYSDHKEMLQKEALDILSICVPTTLHTTILEDVLELCPGIKAIFCEKPIANNLKEARKILELCKEKNVVLSVNHIRRWDDNYLCVLDWLQTEKLGKLLRVSGVYSAQIFNIGTHLLDTMNMFVQEPFKWALGHFIKESDENDPTLCGLLGYENDIVGSIIGLGMPSDLVFEIELFGTEGRIKILENGAKREAFLFKESRRYEHYREYVKQDWNEVSLGERFLLSVSEIVAFLDGKGKISCTGEDAYSALEAAVALCQSANNSSKKIALPLSI
jgi:predicted dehydrogenase